VAGDPHRSDLHADAGEQLRHPGSRALDVVAGAWPAPGPTRADAPVLRRHDDEALGRERDRHRPGVGAVVGGLPEPPVQQQHRRTGPCRREVDVEDRVVVVVVPEDRVGQVGRDAHPAIVGAALHG
jgi:hypothetical protein